MKQLKQYSKVLAEDVGIAQDETATDLVTNLGRTSPEKQAAIKQDGA